MTYIVSSGTLNPTIPYPDFKVTILFNVKLKMVQDGAMLAMADE